MAKIDKIDTSNMSPKEIKAIEKQLEKEAKIAKAEEEKKAKGAKKTDEFDSSSTSVLADYKIENYVKTYIENLIKKYEGYDDIISRLRSYLGNFDIDEFRKDYPDVANNSDLAAAMYNDTQKFL